MDNGGNSMSFKNIIITIGILLVAVFVVQNAQVVEVRIFLWKTEASRALVLLCTLAAGFFIGLFLGYRIRKKNKKVKPEIQASNS